MAKTKNKIRVSFVGANSEDVTGSCTHIQMADEQILLECGLHQSCGSLLNTYKINNEKFKFKPKDISKIFVCHMHIDHIGAIPKLYAQGCTAQIIAPKGSYEMAKILLEDCAYIINKDAESLQKRTGKFFSPIYLKEDVGECLKYWTEYDIGDMVELSDTVSFRYQNSSHILNSAQLELWLKQNNNTKKILYSSDIGSRTLKQYYVNDFTPVIKSNLHIVECTYCGSKQDISMKDREKDLEKIKTIVENTCIENKGKVLFPVFANARMQTILTHLYDLFGNDESFNIPILLDSPMGIKFCNLYSKLLDGEQLEKWNKVYAWANVKTIEEYETSKYYQDLKEGQIILSASGMITAGRSVAWLAKLLPSAKNHIVIVGFAPEDSLAGKIKSGKQKTITIDRKAIPNRCGITSLKTFSSHAQKSDLLKYYSELQTEKVALVHGDMKDKIVFAKELQDEVSKKNNAYKVIAVNKSTEILL